MKYGSRFSARYFEELYKEIKDISASERMIYQKITDIYATVTVAPRSQIAVTKPVKTWKYNYINPNLG